MGRGKMGSEQSSRKRSVKINFVKSTHFCEIFLLKCPLSKKGNGKSCTKKQRKQSGTERREKIVTQNEN